MVIEITSMEADDDCAVIYVFGCRITTWGTMEPFVDVWLVGILALDWSNGHDCPHKSA